MIWIPEPKAKFSEAEIQTAVATYLNGLELLGVLGFFHPANESKRTPRYGARLKAHGMKAGEPDCIVYLKGGKTLLIELKVKTGVLSPAQRGRHRLYTQLGYDVHVVKADGPRAAVKAVEDILRTAGVKI